MVISLNITKGLEGVCVPVVILGDAAYPLLPWLIKSYPETNIVLLLSLLSTNVSAGLEWTEWREHLDFSREDGGAQ